MAFLYVNSRGSAWRKHSYSAGCDFDQCKYKYYLRRVLGWKERDVRASFKFGRALEESIQFFHENDGIGGVEDFTRRWAEHRDNKEIKYTKTEKSWENLQRCGTEMMRLYAIRQPKLPIPLGVQTVFQREFYREVFPEDPTYGGIEHGGKLDVISFVDPEHPMLTKVPWSPELGALRPVIIDIKTSGKDYPNEYGMAGFDMQLRNYSWLAKYPDVAFLVFVKKGHGVAKGSSITLLADVGEYKAGEEAVVASKDGEIYRIVRNDYFIGEMENAQGRNAKGALDTTKAADARKEAWLQANTTTVNATDVTRQRMQFNAGYVTKESAEEAGYVAGLQIKGIVDCWNANKWPNTFGIKFPKDDTSDPYFKAFVRKDKVFLIENFKQLEEESKDDLFADEPETEDET